MPEKIGHYTIVSELGRGGMGVVYKAREERLNRFVAIKVLTDQLTEDSTFLQRFVREAQAAAALSHPNIVQIYFIGEDENGHPYFVMEYVTGRSLNHLLREEGKIDNPRASQLILQAAHGLAAAHDQGIIHRDIKPANLILDDRGLVKIADFGLALPVDAETRLTATGMLVGTPGYLAPEQCRGEKVDHRTDIYALGVTFYTLLSGKPPFHGESPLALLRQILDEQPPDIASLNPNVDAETRRILEKMIAKDRAQRYQNCHEIIADLEEFLAKSGVRSMTAGLATRKTAASAAIAADMPTQVTGGGHDAPTMKVSTVSNAPATKPDIPLREPATMPPTPVPAAAPAAAYTSTSSSGTSARTLLIIAAAVVMLIVGAALLATKVFPSKHQEAAAVPAATTTPASSAPNAPASALLSNEVKPPAIPASSGELPTQTPASAPAQTPAAAPKQIAQASVPANAPANAPAQPSAPASTPAPTPTPTPAPARKLSGVAVAVTGDQGLVGSVSSVLMSELSASELKAVDASTLPSTEDLVRGDPSTSRLIDRLRAEGVAVLLLARVEPSGQRDLNYMGRHDVAYSSRVTLTTYDIATGRPFGTPARGSIEYTSATADRESEKIVGRLARQTVEAIQSH